MDNNTTKKRFSAAESGGPPKKNTKRTERNIPVITPTQGDAENPFVEAVLGLVQPKGSNKLIDDLSLSVLTNLYTTMPAPNPELARATANLMIQMQTKPPLKSPLREISSMLHGTFDEDTVAYVVVQSLRNQIARVEAGIMAKSVDNEIDFMNNSRAMEEFITQWMLTVDMKEEHIVKTAEALLIHITSTVRDNYQIDNLPDFLSKMTSTLQLKAPLLMGISDVVFRRPALTDIPRWTRSHIVSCLLVYNERLCAGKYRPCLFGAACMINNRPDMLRIDDPNKLNSHKDCLVAFWRPEDSDDPASSAVPSICILCFIACVNYSALRHKLYGQNFFHRQMFRVDSSTTDGFPPNYIHQPVVSNETITYVAPFPDVDMLMRNLSKKEFQAGEHRLDYYTLSVGAF